MYWTTLKGNLSSNLILIYFHSWYEILFSLPHGGVKQHQAYLLCFSHPYILFYHLLHTSVFLILSNFYLFFRNYTSSRRLSRPWSTRFHPQHPITLRCGPLLRPPTAMSVRGCCGASPAKACAARSVVLNATRSARTCSMQIVYKVRKSINLYINTSS